MNNKKIAIIGLGYVGLPLAVEFAKKYKVVGFDINISRVRSSKQVTTQPRSIFKKFERVLVENSEALVSKGVGLLPSSNVINISSADIYIVTVPTPV